MAMLDRLSLRTRLVAGMVLLVAVGLLVAGAAATSALRSYQLDRVDMQLAQAASSPILRTEVAEEGAGDGRGRGTRGRLPGEFYRAVLDEDGSIVADTDTDTERGRGRGDSPDVPSLSVTAARDLNLEPFTVDSEDGNDQWRVIDVPVQYAGAPATVLLGSDLGEVDDTVGRLIVLQLLIGAIVLAGITGLGLIVVRSSLRGLLEVEVAATAVAGGQFDSRVPERHPTTEIGRLARSFNGMVSHVQSAFAEREASEQRLRRFVADASHELRTPLTSIRGFAELHRQGAVTERKDVARLMRRIEDEAKRMGMLVEDLLALARLDEQRPLHLEQVDLAALAADAVHDAAAIQPDRPVTVDAPESVVIPGDEARLRQILTNLLSNAYQHTPHDAPVEVRVRRVGPDAVLEVADRGPGMDADTASRVFERFFRADASRTRASGGSGLGLSIVTSLVKAHGGRVELDTAPGQGAVFRVVIPAQTA